MLIPYLKKDGTKHSLGLLSLLSTKPMYWHPRCGEVDFAGVKQGVQATHVQKTELPNGFHGMIFKAKFGVMAVGCVTFFWLVDGEVTGWCSRNLVLSLKLTSSIWDCSHEIKRHVHLGRKAMKILDSIFKIRDITLLTKVHIVKVKISPVIMHRCESWTIKKAEHWRIDAFKLWCWRILRVPWTARSSN